MKTASCAISVTFVLQLFAAECVTCSTNVFAEILVVLKSCCFSCQNIFAAFIVFSNSKWFWFLCLNLWINKTCMSCSLKIWLKHNVNYSTSILTTFCKQNKVTWHELTDHVFETPGPMRERKSYGSAQELRVDYIWVATGEWTQFKCSFTYSTLLPSPILLFICSTPPWVY
jgi:hypothetical protein